jgi:uncharacterized protein YjbI with pentapeptide repeats
MISEPITKTKIYQWQYRHNKKGEYLNLSMRNLVLSDLQSVTFYNANLIGADFRKSNLAKTKFIECRIDWALFQYSILDDALFDHCTIVGANFRGARMNGITFIKTPIKSAYITKNDLPYEKYWTKSGKMYTKI